MKQPKRTLSPGDIVYCLLSTDRINERLTVVQVSDTIAYLARSEKGQYIVTVLRECSPRPGSTVKQVLKSGWDTMKYRTESPELNTKYQHAELVHMVQVAAKSKADSLSSEQLKLILTILNDTENAK